PRSRRKSRGTSRTRPNKRTPAMRLGGVPRIMQMQFLQVFVTIAISALILSEPIGFDVPLFAAVAVAVVWAGRKG
ncbi:MAG: hypothetical protein AAFV62_00735, partial [Pseudomonadota bacterium]